MLIFSIALPLAAGVICPFCKRMRRAVKLTILLLLQLIQTGVIGYLICAGQEETVFGSLTAQITIGLCSDGLSKIFAAVIGIGWLAVLLYCAVYMKHVRKEDQFYAFLFLTEAAMLATVFASNLVSMYLFYEFVTLCSMPLVLQERTKEAIAGAKKYLFYSIAGAFLALFGIFVLAANADSLNFAAGGTLNLQKAAENRELILAGVFCAVVGFGAKAGMFPLHGWLPSAHPVAPAPASALLSGVIAKSGVIAVIRVMYYIAGCAFLKGTWVQSASLWLALLTILMGSMMAYREKNLKKRLAYSTVSQISYVFAGVFLLTEEGLCGGLLQVVFHAVVKMGLFLAAGAVIYLTGKTEVDELSGLGKRMPVTFWCYTILSLSLIGIPPTGGFVGKWQIASAALAGGSEFFSICIPIVLLVSALLTAGYLLPITVQGFYPGKDAAVKEERIREPLCMKLPLIVFAALTVVLGVFFAPLTGWISALCAAAV